jgi:L-threonate 2-dehydrogenase
MKPGACVIACATMAPDFAKELAARCESHQVHYLDAPISGGSVKASTGQLSVMAAGTQAAFTAAAAALDGMAEKVFKLGDEAGHGSVMKSINQLLAGVHIAAMGEAMTFGIKQGIAPEQILEVISQSAGNSWMFSNRAPHLIAGDYTPHSAVDIWLKDLGIVLDVAKQEKIPAPLTAAALQQYIAASSIGLGRDDDAAVAKVYARNANIELPGTA